MLTKTSEFESSTNKPFVNISIDFLFGTLWKNPLGSDSYDEKDLEQFSLHQDTKCRKFETTNQYCITAYQGDGCAYNALINETNLGSIGITDNIDGINIF